MTFHVPEKFQVTFVCAPNGDAHNGYFSCKLKCGQQVFVIASNGAGWEHVSVSRKDRPPTWDEMCQVKALFWDAEDCVVQYHPPKTEYVNNHPHCLHLWSLIDGVMPMPPSILVGLKEAGPLK